MKKILIIIGLLVSLNNCKAQYFNSYTYFKQTGGFNNYYPFDSLEVISVDSLQQTYRLFEYVNKLINFNAHMNIKIISNKIFFQLPNNIDSNYHLMFDLNATTGDSFYIKTFRFNEYFHNPNNNLFFARIDSFLCKVTKTDIVNYKGTMRKTWKTKIATSTYIKYDFVDSIGFLDLGLTPFNSGYNRLINVCSGDSIIHKDSSKNEPYYCDKDSFRSHYNSLHTLSAARGLSLFPNPSKSSIIIKDESKEFNENTIIKILNCHGQIQKLKFKLINAAEIEINIGDYQDGFYTLLLDNSTPIKFIKTE